MNLFLIGITISISISLAGQVRNLTLEPNHSTIGFEVAIAGGATKVTGKFMESDLKLTYFENDWTKSKIEYRIKVESIDTGIEGRDEHLRSKDFFEVDSYPEITFLSDSIERTGDRKYIASGTFTMHGISKNIRIPFEETYNEGNTIGVHLQTTLNRIEYQVGHTFVHTDIPDFISDNIVVKINFWTKRDKSVE